MAEMIFREIIESELEAVVELLDTGFNADKEVLEVTMQTIFDLPDTWGHTYGLWDGDLLVGTISYGSCYGPDWNGEGIISHLVVREGHRRKGLARKMIDRALADLKALKVPCVTVTVEIGNDVALAMWKSYGFEKYDPAFEVVGYYEQYEGYVKWFGGKENS